MRQIEEKKPVAKEKKRGVEVRAFQEQSSYAANHSLFAQQPLKPHFEVPKALRPSERDSLDRSIALAH